MSRVADRLAGIRERIATACARCSRPAGDVTLLAVSKTFPAGLILEAHAAGQVDFGESRQQEGSAKVIELPGGLRWHFIGTLQRNKVRKVLADFRVLHSVDSLRLAAHVDRLAGELGVRPEVYLEVNLPAEERKAGFPPEDLEAALPEILAMEHLDLKGLMVIPPAVDEPEWSRPWFRRARALRDRLLPGMGLSMGMSGDFEVAIEEGATVVRVGSAIFGERGDP